MNDDIFSPTELKVLEILGRRKMKISQITAEILEGRRVYLQDQNHVAGAIRRINEKCERHNLPWFLNGIGLGRGGRVVWKDRH